MNIFPRPWAIGIWAISAITADIALACDNSVKTIAYALQSPIATRPVSIETRFGEPLPVIARAATGLTICFNGEPVSIDAKHLATAQTAEILKFHPTVYEAERPSLGFWRTVDGIADHLDFANDDLSGPDWREQKGGDFITPVGFPILQSQQISTQLGTYTAVQILLPLSTSARNHFRAHIEEQRNKITPTIIFDASMSAAEFLPLLWQNTRAAGEFDQVADAPIKAIAVMGDGSHRIWHDTTLDELTSREPPVLSGDEAPMPPKAISNALSEMPATAQPLIWAFMGGDAEFTLPKDYTGAIVAAFQITPELDGELENSLTTDQEYFPFSMNHAPDLLKLAAGVPGFGETSNGLAQVANAQSDQGFLPFLPSNPDLATDMAEVDDAGNWVAIPVWTVRNANVFQ